MITLQTLRKMAKRLPGCREEPSYGTPGFKAGKKLIARLHQQEDAIVVILSSVEEQQTLIARDPMIFYIIGHFQGYPAILVRPTISEREFFALFEHSWRRAANKKDIALYDVQHN